MSASAGTRSYNSRHSDWMVGMVAVMTILTWVYATQKTYRISADHPLYSYYYAFLDIPFNYKLWVPMLFSMIWGTAFMVAVLAYTRTGFEGSDFVRRQRGPRWVSAVELKDICSNWGKKQLRLMGIPVPLEVENQHFGITGSTGSGKSQAIAEFFDSAHRRGDRTICVDPNGGFMQHFFKKGDVILNPFDARGLHWSLFNEIKSAYDVEQFSVATIPRSPSTEQEQWNSMARTIVAEVMLKLKKLGKGTTDQFVYWLCTASNDDLQKMLADTAAAGMFHGAEETLGSVRAVLTRYITPHKYLSDNKGAEQRFSIRDWMEYGSGNLWITWQEDMLPALKPLISCFLDVACAASLSTPVENAQDMHLIVDEADSLEKLNYIIQAATKARKHKFKITLGFQSWGQVDSTYGEKDALTLRNSLRNSLYFGIGESDTYTAKQVADAIGEHEVIRKQLEAIGGSRGVGARMRYVTVKEQMVFASQIHQLPNLTCYLKFAGELPFAKVKMKYKSWPKVTEPMQLIDGEWTREIKSGSGTLKFRNPNAVV